MAMLYTPGFQFSFSALSEAKIIPVDAFTEKIIQIFQNWYRGEAFYLNTSGSTGAPKPIRLHPEAMRASVMQSAKAFGLKKGDTLFCCLSTEHIAGLMMVIRAIVLEADLVVIPPESTPFKTLSQFNKNIDFAALVPLQLEDAMQFEGINLLKAIIIGGAPLNTWQRAMVKTLKVPAFQTYGMTETYTHVAIRPLNGEKSSELYQALDGISFSTDSNHRLKIHAPALLIPEMQTNDVVNLKDAHHFEWLGRFDNVINSGGIKISLERMEESVELVFHQLNMKPIAIFAQGMKDERLGERLVLYLESEPWTEEIRSYFEEALKKELNNYFMPKEFIFIPKFERTSLGKIDKINTLKNNNKYTY